MPADWFRQQAWGEAERDAFFVRLARAREASRPEYLYIRGIELLQAGLPAAARELFEMSLAADSTAIHAAANLGSIGACHEALGNVEAALESYLSASRRMQDKGQIQTQAWLDFVWLAAVRQLTDRYQQAADLIDRFAFSGGIVFPEQDFRVSAARAMMLGTLGHRDTAAKAARRALEAAGKRHSGLPRHPKVGLVASVEPAIRERLERLARGEPQFRRGEGPDGRRPRGLLGWFRR